MRHRTAGTAGWWPRICRRGRFGGTGRRGGRALGCSRDTRPDRVPSSWRMTRRNLWATSQHRPSTQATHTATRPALTLTHACRVEATGAALLQALGTVKHAVGPAGDAFTGRGAGARGAGRLASCRVTQRGELCVRPRGSESRVTCAVASVEVRESAHRARSDAAGAAEELRQLARETVRRQRARTGGTRVGATAARGHAVLELALRAGDHALPATQ